MVTSMHCTDRIHARLSACIVALSFFFLDALIYLSVIAISISSPQRPRTRPITYQIMITITIVLTLTDNTLRPVIHANSDPRNSGQNP
jgi:hypothetical protein